jgi:hypothetical protein
VTPPLRLLDSPPEQARELGASMESAQVLDVIERLHNAAEHPDITMVERYGRDLKPGGQSPAGVAITYRSGSQAYLWADEGKREPVPHPLPERMPELKFRAQHALKFLIDLLDVARPDMFVAWRPVAFADVAMTPSGLGIRCTDGSTAYLRVTSGFGGFADLDRDEFSDYTIPEGVKTCLREASAQSAAPA